MVMAETAETLDSGLRAVAFGVAHGDVAPIAVGSEGIGVSCLAAVDQRVHGSLSVVVAERMGISESKIQFPDHA
ncbi:hypothetical protein OR16_21488 [Cupriavidus basilensis OR16]|uniref:Uncharacterized protein n=1 Tax=Cupriavidus basilensis OR16 TaxID=1127483 RepID=H1S8I6_9BURK|nr:hypothetical protein OR16_21488 [Cupriavidus basilensis OR16]